MITGWDVAGYTGPLSSAIERGTEIGILGGYGFQSQVTAGDGSDKKGKMGAGYNNLRRKKKKH